MISWALVAAFLAAFLLKKSAWPFLRYPMFSRPLRAADVRAYRFQLEALDGSVTWWQPRFYRDLDHFGDHLAQRDPRRTLWCVAQLARLIALEEGTTAAYRAVRVVERRWVDGRTADQTIATMPLPKVAHPGSPGL